MRERDTSGSTMVLKILHSSGRERDIATWEACTNVVRDITVYREEGFVLADDLSKKLTWIESLRNMNIDTLTMAAQSDPFVFGQYRNAVWDNEGANARKLQVLVWVLRTLYRLRDLESADADIIDPLAQRVSEMLHFEWRVKNVPLEGDYRDWATRSTRRYDLMPRVWRFV